MDALVAGVSTDNQSDSLCSVPQEDGNKLYEVLEVFRFRL